VYACSRKIFAVAVCALKIGLLYNRLHSLLTYLSYEGGRNSVGMLAKNGSILLKSTWCTCFEMSTMTFVWIRSCTLSLDYALIMLRNVLQSYLPLYSVCLCCYRRRHYAVCIVWLKTGAPRYEYELQCTTIVLYWLSGRPPLARKEA